MLKTKQTKIVLLPSLQEVTSYLQQIANATKYRIFLSVSFIHPVNPEFGRKISYIEVKSFVIYITQ